MSVHPTRRRDVVFHDSSSRGTNQISAVYSGDAEVQGSTASTVSKVASGPSATTPSGSRSTPGAGPVPGSSPPQFASLPFLGLPDFGGVASTGGARSGGTLFAFPLTLSLPDFATSTRSRERVESRSDRMGQEPSGRWCWRHGGSGPCRRRHPPALVTYMVSTWTQDRRRARRVVPVLAGNAPPDREPGSSKPEEPVHQP